MNAYIRWMDALARGFGYVATALVLATCLISAGNASIRYAFHMSSNAWLEIQWYLFSATVFFGAPVLVTLNEHVRVDVVYTNLSGRTKSIIDLLGFIFFYLPVCGLMFWASLQFVEQSWAQQEMSNNAGGLIRWPVKALIPVGFTLLILQGIAEIFKRIGYLRGTYNMDTHYERPLQ